MNHLLVPILLAAAAPSAGPVTATKTADAVEFRVGKDVVATWPLLAPGGVKVTEFAPGDHVWHKSVWFGHEDIIPEGVELKVKAANKRIKGVDFWTDRDPTTGRVVCVEAGQPKTVSADHALVSTRNEWRTSDGMKVMDEARTVHFVELPNGRLIVFDIDLHASEYPLTFGDTKDGTMAIRVNPAMRVQVGAKEKDAPAPTGKITSSTGKTAAPPEKDSPNLGLWGEIADWHDYSGTVDGKPVGITIFADPKNSLPSIWHTRAYGLMAANLFGRQGTKFPSQKDNPNLFKLPKGEHLKLRFGVYAHSGDAADGKVAEAYKTFAEMK
jgi:hypothetical protein